MNSSIRILKNINNEQEGKFNLILMIIGNLLRFKLGSNDTIIPIADEIRSLCSDLRKISDQCNGMINCAELYFTLKDTKKSKECINEAKRFADFSLTNPENLYLFINILNKYIYFLEVIKDDKYFFSKDEIDNIIECIKNLISAFKNELIAQSF